MNDRNLEIEAGRYDGTPRDLFGSALVIGIGAVVMVVVLMLVALLYAWPAGVLR